MKYKTNAVKLTYLPVFAPQPIEIATKLSNIYRDFYDRLDIINQGHLNHRKEHALESTREITFSLQKQIHLYFTDFFALLQKIWGLQN